MSPADVAPFAAPERSPIASAPLSVVLVARNAAPYLDVVLRAWANVLTALNREYEVFLVDDGSSDETALLSTSINFFGSRLQLLRNERPLGFGAALRTGLEASRLPLVCYCTCDRLYEPTDLQRFLETIDQVDVVAGYRHWQLPPLWLRRLGMVYRVAARVGMGIPLEPLPCWLGWSEYRRQWWAYWLFGVILHDAMCSFRLFRREVLARVPLQSLGTVAHVEFMAKANFLGAWIAQVPVTYHPPAETEHARNFALESPSWSEIRRLFTNPDFGPTNLAEPLTPLPVAANVVLPPMP